MKFSNGNPEVFLIIIIQFVKYLWGSTSSFGKPNIAGKTENRNRRNRSSGRLPEKEQLKTTAKWTSNVAFPPAAHSLTPSNTLSFSPTPSTGFSPSSVCFLSMFNFPNFQGLGKNSAPYEKSQVSNETRAVRESSYLSIEIVYVVLYTCRRGENLANNRGADLIDDPREPRDLIECLPFVILNAFQISYKRKYSI